MAAHVPVTTAVVPTRFLQGSASARSRTEIAQGSRIWHYATVECTFSPTSDLKDVGFDFGMSPNLYPCDLVAQKRTLQGHRTESKPRGWRIISTLQSVRRTRAIHSWRTGRQSNDTEAAGPSQSSATWQRQGRLTYRFRHPWTRRNQLCLNILRFSVSYQLA